MDLLGDDGQIFVCLQHSFDACFEVSKQNGADSRGTTMMDLRLELWSDILKPVLVVTEHGKNSANCRVLFCLFQRRN